MNATRIIMRVWGMCLALAVGLAIEGCGPTNGGNTNDNANGNTNANGNANGNANDNSNDPNAQICEEQDRCCGGDGFCDTDVCVADDLDCADCSGGGECTIGCTPRDPDCDNAEVCERSEFCCEDDGNCDVEECNDPDPDCAACGTDTTCVIGCTPPDADCTNEEICAVTEFCCPDDDICDTTECADPDTDCANCVADDACVALCAEIDPDCTTNDEICVRAGFCCPDDPFCDVSECPQPDPDCP